MRDFEAEERINRALRARRRAEIRKRRRRRARIKRALVLGGTGLGLFLIILAGVGLVKMITGRHAQAAEQTADTGRMHRQEKEKQEVLRVRWLLRERFRL